MGIVRLPDSAQPDIRQGFKDFCNLNSVIMSETINLSCDEFKGYVSALSHRASFNLNKILWMVNQTQRLEARFDSVSLSWKVEAPDLSKVTLEVKHEGGIDGNIHSQNVQLILGECCDEFEGVVALEVQHECKHSSMAFKLNGYDMTGNLMDWCE